MDVSVSGPLAGRRVFITGGTGFLGSHLTRALHAASARVSIFRGDITDARAVLDAVAAAEPELVFHLAAYGTTPLQRDEARMRAVNVGGVEHLWRAIDSRTCRVVQTGTCAEYGPIPAPLHEDQECRPES